MKNRIRFFTSSALINQFRSYAVLIKWRAQKSALRMTDMITPEFIPGDKGGEKKTEYRRYGRSWWWQAFGIKRAAKKRKHHQV